MSISQTECHTECQSILLGVIDPQTYTALQAEIKIQKNQKEPRKKYIKASEHDCQKNHQNIYHSTPSE